MRNIPRKSLATAAALTLVALAHLGVVDEVGRQYTEKGLTRALVTFGVARGLNGVISVAQGTEVAIQPAGIGLNFAPGQILDPVNDLVERFSWIMLASSTSLGIQRVLHNITAWPGFTLVMGIMLGLSLVLLWQARFTNRPVRMLVYKLAVMLIVLRFAIPLIAIASEGFYVLFLAPEYTESTRQLEAATENISNINRAAENEITGDEPESVFDKARKFYDATAEQFDVTARIEEYRQAAAHVSEYTINLIVVFVLQTILLPLVFLWATVKLLKYIARMAS
jgi:hypothetical protein